MTEYIQPCIPGLEPFMNPAPPRHTQTSEKAKKANIQKRFNLSNF